MNQLHVVHDIGSKTGGEGLAALRYSHAIAMTGSSVTLFVAERHNQENQPPTPIAEFKIAGGALETGAKGLRHLIAQTESFRRCLRENRFDLVHLHGTWSPILAVACYLARRHGLPVVVSPHGCLEPWALAHKGLKKRLALATYQSWVFSAASLIVATANQELDSIRVLGFSNPVAVVPLGVDLAHPRSGRSAGTKRILFLSRIHPKKGIPDLVEAWQRVRKPGWKVVVAGASDDGYADTIKALVRDRGLRDDFEFPGLVLGDDKERCFADADVFVLPTYSENFGIAVAEALARGLPVITTTGTPWEDLRMRNCGWWVEPGVDGVAAALTEAISMPPSMLAEMGLRGRLLIEEKYTWSKVGQLALAVSRWAASPEGIRPEAIRL